jgi:hypothetical protein
MERVQQAVQEFEEEVRVPWRPRLVLVQEPPSPSTAAGGATAAAAARRRPARPGGSRVGACRPPAPRRPDATTRSTDGRRTRSAASPGSPAGAGARAGRRRAAVRFTRRAHRLAIALALSGGVLAGSLIGQLFPAGGSPDLRLAGGSSVVVDSGDTLWSIAATVAPEEDVRLVVDRIQELNGLRSTELVPGQVLLLP